MHGHLNVKLYNLRLLVGTVPHNCHTIVPHNCATQLVSLSTNVTQRCLQLRLYTHVHNLYIYIFCDLLAIFRSQSLIILVSLIPSKQSRFFVLLFKILMCRGADKSLARPARKQTTATEDFDVHISYFNHNWRNIITIYIYKKTSIKRNILTIKQNILTIKQNTSGSRSG